MPRVDEGLAPGIPGLSTGAGLSQSTGLWNYFSGLSGNSSITGLSGSPIGLLLALTKAT